MEKKLANKSRENIIYLSEDDARALGIVEGDTESIFVDGKKVSLSFIDEHEIFDMTPEERRILNNALSIRKREIATNYGKLDPNSKSSYLVPYGSSHESNPDFDSLQVSTKGKGFFGTIKSFLFGRKGKPASAEARDHILMNKYKNRTDIFTNEEIQIIQEVISRAQGNSYGAYKSTPKAKTTKKSKKSKSKKSSSRTLVTTSPKKEGVTSPKKKAARRAARKNAKKSKK